MARLVGEVDLAPVPLTMNKSEFARDRPEWTAVEQRMHVLMAPIAKRLAEAEMAPPPASALKTAEQVRRLLSQVLRLAEREEAFPGLAAARSRSDARTPPTRRQVAQLETPPAPPRLPNADEQKRRGFGQVVVRPLDPAIRSQTVVESQVTTVVVNSPHHPFIKRA